MTRWLRQLDAWYVKEVKVSIYVGMHVCVCAHAYSNTNE